MGDQQTRSHGGGPLIVAMPQRIDIGNARTVGDDLQAAFDAGVTVVIADLTSTLSCTAAGVHELALACERAAARNIDLRLAIPPGEALRVFALTGHDRWLPVYPDVLAALAGPASRGGSHESAPLSRRWHLVGTAGQRRVTAARPAYPGARSRKCRYAQPSSAL